MKNYIISLSFFLIICMCTQGMAATVEVSPGDDIQASVEQAGAGGTVIFAPGKYTFSAYNPSVTTAIKITSDLEGITLQGAGTSFDPNNGTILDGEPLFLGFGVRVEASNVTVEGFTFTGFMETATSVEAPENIEFRNCSMIVNGKAAFVEGESGMIDFGNNDFSQAIRYVNCAMAIGDDIVELEGPSSVLLLNCDIRDVISDMMETEDDSTLLILNSIIMPGVVKSDINQTDNSIIEIRNSVFYDAGQPNATLEEGMDIDGDGIFIFDSIYADPLHVNARFDVRYEDFDFHLQPDSPAIDIGVDLDGNTTYAGSAGPAQ